MKINWFRYFLAEGVEIYCVVALAETAAKMKMEQLNQRQNYYLHQLLSLQRYFLSNKYIYQVCGYKYHLTLT